MTIFGAWSPLLFVLFLFCEESISLRNVILDIEPKVVQRGGYSTLSCSYDLGESQLYTVKWYRGQHEFYRYTPSEHPSTKTFPFRGVNVDIDLDLSNEHQVVLRNVDFQLSGKFSCEVTTETPILTVTADTNMTVVVLPEHPPSLTTDKSFYVVGDVLKVNCSSSPARPAVILSFLMNNLVVCEKCETRKYPVDDLFWSEISLQLPLFPSHFLEGRLVLRCVAAISDIYQTHTEMRLDNTKDPIPERVTFPHNSSVAFFSPKTFVSIIVLLALIFR
ncbi:uncharacterized protein [Onthophagus taurus]|uniref:uncharacterized protein n=1 Tax=Onthophagus taurus TaxID=166361 RepID=UPI000C1FE8AA|nr:uncharacterized protein LOC111428443 [Onthophagus taurus]